MLKRLWLDDAGVILSTELILIMVILVIGLVTGMKALQTAVDIKLADIAGAVGAIDPSFGFTGSTYVDGGGAGLGTWAAYVNGTDYQSDAAINNGVDLYGCTVLVVTTAVTGETENLVAAP